MTLELVFMSDENPPPYSAAVATPLVGSLEYPDTALPFSHSDQLATKIVALVSEGKTLDTRFKDVRDAASAPASKFEYREPAFVLCQKFETLIWQSRNVAGIALVAVKDFNEIVLDFLSEPDVGVQDRLKELANASKSLQRESDSVINQKSSLEALIKELEDLQRLLHSELGAPISTRQRQGQSRGRGAKGRAPWIHKSSLIVPRSEPSSATVSLGVIPRSCMDYVLQIERAAEMVVFPWCVSSSSEAQATSPAEPNPRERRRICPSVEHAELTALPGMVDSLVRDLCAFAGRIDVLNTVFPELAREQDIFVLYLKDGQSVANRGYRSEINRMRRRLPCVCNALDAYSKAKLP